MYHDIDDHSVTGPLDNAPHKHKWGEAGNKPKQEKTEGQNGQRAWAEKSSASQADVLYLTDFHTLFYRAEYDYMAEDASVLSFVTGDIIEWGQSHTYTQSTSSVVHMGQALMEGTSSLSTDEWWVQVQQEEEEVQKATFGCLKLLVTVKYSYVNTKTGEQSRDLPQEAEDDIDLSMTDDAPLALIHPSSSSRTSPGILGSADLGSSSAPYASGSSNSQSQPGFSLPRCTDTSKPWIRRHLADDGTSYYYQNQVNGRVQWTRPESLTSGASGLPEMPSYTHLRQKTYYVDTVRRAKDAVERVIDRLNSDFSKFSEVDSGVDVEFGDLSNSDASAVVPLSPDLAKPPLLTSSLSSVEHGRNYGKWWIQRTLRMLFSSSSTYLTYLTYFAFIEFPTLIFEDNDNSPSFFYLGTFHPSFAHTQVVSSLPHTHTDLSQTLPTAPSLLHMLKAGVQALYDDAAAGRFWNIYRFCGFLRVKRGSRRTPPLSHSIIFFLRVVIPTLNSSSSSKIPSPPPSSYPFIPSSDFINISEPKLEPTRAKFELILSVGEPSLSTTAKGSQSCRGAADSALIDILISFWRLESMNRQRVPVEAEDSVAIICVGVMGGDMINARGATKWLRWWVKLWSLNVV
ncbi:hypothetical protein F5051DRAFT_483361 [Lentinula edodes]|nr:hypothetical protein F5051DRAFT_483361 [Lentinula edodes]